MPKAVKSGLFHSLRAARGVTVLALDLLAALSLMGAVIMLILGLSAGDGQWMLSLIPLLAALIFRLSSHLYDRALRKLTPAGVTGDEISAAGLANRA
jgi:hypothetical protein